MGLREADPLANNHGLPAWKAVFRLTTGNYPGGHTMELSLTSVIYDAGGVVFGTATGLRVIPTAGQATDLVMVAGGRGREWLLPLCHLASAGGNNIWLREEFEKLLDLVPHATEAPAAGPEHLAAPVAAVTLRPGMRVRARNRPLGRLKAVDLNLRSGALGHIVVEPGILLHGPTLNVDWSYVGEVAGDTIRLTLSHAEIRSLMRVP